MSYVMIKLFWQQVWLVIKKILNIFLICAVLAGMTYGGIKLYDALQEEENHADTDFRQIDKNTGQSGVRYGENLKGKDLQNNATYKLDGSDSSCSAVIPTGEGAKYYELSRKEGPPLGYIKISRNGKIEGHVYSTEILVKTDLFKEKNGVKVVNSGVLILKEKGPFPGNSQKWINKPYPLEIKTAQADADLKKDERRKIVFAFTPDIGVSFVGALNSASFDIRPSLGFTMINLKKGDLTSIRFLRLGIGASIKDKCAEFNVSPVLYNLGNKVKFMRNTYIGPIVGYDTNKNITLGGAIVLNF